MSLLLTSRRTLLAGLGASALSACATTPPAPRFTAPPLARLDASVDQLTRITVCTRPFRAAGPRLDVETVGAKRVVHNYGHGGSGWSLSWGSAEIAAQRALEGGAKDIAVIGCGAIGLTTALTLRRAGAAVTIYTKERAPDTRSFRATGLWSPDSRIADADKVDAAFPDLWEKMARTSWAKHQTYLGLPGEPVSFHDRYTLSDRLGVPRVDPPGAIRFASYHARLRDIVPRGRDLEPGEHRFPVAGARFSTAMQFNVTELMHLLTNDFLVEGGRIAMMEFRTPVDLARLPQPVVVNCTGYGARALWGDETLTPVRGQIAWLAPQPAVRYGVFYRGVSMLPRPDGVVIQHVGDSDMVGYGRVDETPDRAEAEAAIATMAGLYGPAYGA